MDSISKLRKFTYELLAEHGTEKSVTDSESLILSGLIDSLAVMEIVVFMESEFGIDFADLYFNQSNFDSIELMIDFVQKHRP